MKSRHIMLEYFRSIALRINRHEQHLHAPGITAQLLHHVGHFHQRRRTNVRTMGKSEKQRDDLAFEISERTQLAIVVGQFEGFTKRCAGDIGQFEHRLVTLTAASGQRDDQPGEQCCNKVFHCNQKNNCR